MMVENNSYKFFIKKLADEFVYDVKKALNVSQQPTKFMEPQLPEPFYGCWNSLQNFINERKENEEYFWMTVEDVAEFSKSPVEFWDQLSGCFSDMVINGSYLVNEAYDIKEDEEN